ncbi:hypothetical protein [uncultured Mycolicibacterium sp.]|uniref:hypothetical protein n=1 Tax=uncultured Mycolicibacterium sp. TaxID=2320817 RepID=UPI0026146A6F|nr:hypothetical protein [uncultured Mycolicibacterium sp.]
MTVADVVVLKCGERRLPRPLAGLPECTLDEVTEHRRVIVVGSESDLAAVLARLMKAERLDIEVARATGWFTAMKALRGTARRVPLIRDETGAVIVGAAEWRGPAEGAPLYGEAVVDDEQLFDGEVPGVRVEPTESMPGLRAAVLSASGRPGRWITGRAAQLGTTGVQVVRDGVAAPRTARRSTFYRHIEGWLKVG